jgi:predicted Zn-dependent peptidase
LLDADALQRQKQIMRQDLAQRRANPGQVIEDTFLEAIFAGHPLSTPVLGTEESIDAVTREALLEDRDRMWGAANTVLTVVGRIRAQDALARAQAYFGDMASGSPNLRPAATVQVPAEPEVVGRQAGQQQAQFRIGFVVPGLLEVDRYPLTVLNAIMSGSAGRLFRELRSERGLAYVAFTGYSGYSDAGAWYASAGVDPDNLEPALEVTRAEIEKLRAGAPDATEVAAKQEQIAGRQILADETNAALAGRLASQEILGTESTEEFVRRIRQVTPDDILRVADAYLDPDHSLLVVVGPRLG